MRRQSIAALAIGASLAVAACGGGASAPATPSAAASASPASPSVTAAGTAAVTIASFTFAPASLGIAPGTTVSWANQDDVAHTVAWDDGAAGSGRLSAGGTPYARTFDRPGTYAYHCSIHPSMKGTVVVGP